MISLRSISGILIGILLLMPNVAGAESAVPGCLSDVYARLYREQRIYRSVLYGQKAASQDEVGSVRIDREFDMWQKTAINAWQSPQNEGLTWSDALMDEQSDVPVRRGLFEIKETPTSDLIPPLTQSLRALRCRLQSVCGAMRESISAKEGTSFTVQTDGCIAITFDDIPSCSIAPSFGESFMGACNSAVAATMEREEKLLQLAVAYDSAYRSLLQFAGIFEGFMNDFRFPLLQPLWQAARALGAIDHLPCFSSQCDE